MNLIKPISHESIAMLFGEVWHVLRPRLRLHIPWGLGVTAGLGFFSAFKSFN